MPQNTFVLQSEIELITGFGIEQLRKWRQRFGFPPAQYDGRGRAIYSRDTIDRLMVIKRLLEAGFRPGHVVAKTVLENLKTAADLNLFKPHVERSDSTNALISLLSHLDIEAFKALLRKQRAKRSMLDFVKDTIAPLMIGIGDAWAGGEIDVHHEHLCSSMIERYLIAETLKSIPKAFSPVFLFAMPPGERHQLGLLMVEAVMADAGAYIINVGTDIPLNSLKLAATECKVDVVALTFSFSYPPRDVVPTLAHLRRLLPQSMLIWAGGAGLSQVKRAPKGVRIISHFDEAITALGELVRAGQLR
ncbi:MerR family transcriptional regulator [Limnohabitans sp. Rim8]|uniref:MerR family transcriptional regulator n=1 Tax=Limnohabitans sp. Rim8 TaxID=1100718 RepID=UPI00262416C7|nr:MerR family transcriptional regulator [Limnohabitans sp. Rim8]